MDKKSSKKSTATRQGDVPLFNQMADLALEQMERLAPVMNNAVKDAQTIYLNGVRKLLKSGEAIGKRSKYHSKVIQGAGRVFEKVVPPIVEVEIEASNAVTRVAQESIRLMRKKIKQSRT